VNTNKAIFAVFSLAIAAVASVPSTALAQNFPNAPIKFVVPYAPGGSTDILARAIAESLSRRFSQPVVVVNQPGAGGVIGTLAVARSAPDGYTMLMATNGTHAINPSLYSKLPYDAVKDFEPISLVAAVPLLLAVPAKSEVKTLRNLVERYQDRKAPLNFGSAGVGSSGHLVGEMLKIEGKLDALHVAYKGDGPAVVDLMGGRIDYLFANMPAAINQVRTASLRALAVTSAQRSPELPDVPTVVEAGYPRLQVDPWYGVLVPARTSREIVAKLNDAINSALQDPAVRKRFEGLGATPRGTSPEKFAQVIAADTAKFAEVIKISGAKAE
jgi:tripartite-type tricarboxylate transporter receptor subunit TctC